MCGIVGLVSSEPVNQRLYDALLLLQHRGQDAAGIATLDGLNFHMHKAMGMVRDVFRTRNMRDLPGNWGIGHVRYPTQGCASDGQESQPFYVNAPYGIMFAHNGNLTNADAVRQALWELDHRHINTTSDSEVLLNVIADELANTGAGSRLKPEEVFRAVSGVHRRVQGSYAVVALIAGNGLLAFRDPMGIRPLAIAKRETPGEKTEYMVASESCAFEALGFTLIDDVKPGEAVWIDRTHTLHRQQCADHPQYHTCAFEYVYFARPDSVIDGISVYDARLRMGEQLAKEIKKQIPLDEIDVVMPIPDSSRPSTQQLAQVLGLPYREGLIKNRYIGRTFIMPGQATRKKSVRQKLNAMPIEFKGKNVLLVDDSIVRGTTIREIVRMARDAGAKKVFVATAAPAVRYPNVYGIDMPTRSELIAGNGRAVEDIRREIEVDALVYQTVEGLHESLTSLTGTIKRFDMSCFDGVYVTGDITSEYLDALEASRSKPAA